MEKIKSLDWYWQLAILAGIAAVLVYGVRYFVTNDVRAETEILNDQTAQLRTKNDDAKRKTERLSETRALYAAKQQEYDELKVLLPEQREITNVLQGLQDTARDSRLIISRFFPKEDTQQNSIMEKPVEIEVDSNFNNLRDFFDRMAKLPRIVSIKDFTLKQLDKQTADRTLHSTFTLTAYYASPENLAPPTTPGAPAPTGTQPAPNQPATAPAAAK
ncbi:MAG: type 4a pilus biogenesis protein PilO [Pyrinomonadaceae bacterium]